ncbi:regulation of nuclear pre-mRNA domain-containing protein 2 [Scaptodrosophila lebanonensis]|uniref:Regulation of nuclear pre-mRNA domain-containing protein 2 n=1 Tax=Drosophila lebanonensis TaxID=7225 RepID=A0A6J2U619_DROLE|nr:regulation of nuclear pre-mRNA domain-containing protein 2 [Scaptodrosophila lebanonensis]
MAKALAAEPFDEELFETRLEALKDTQEGIQQMSTWCLQHRPNHKKIIQCWLNVFKRVRVDHRLVLFYLANDVIQYSKRKRYEFVECWATALQRATTMVRDERVKSKILRIFKIWEQREIYNEEFLSDLSGLLNIAPPKKSHASADQTDEFQSVVLIANVRECVELSEATDKSFKKLPKPPTFEIEAIKQQLKDKSHSGDIEKELERYVAFITAYNKNLQNEIKTRKTVLENIDLAKKFYEHQRGEVKVVASAYKSFGNRIKLVKRKLDEIIPTLSSPIPSPDINAPSPERDADLQLPDDNSAPLSINIFNTNINGFSGYLDGGQLPFDINDFKRESKLGNGSSQPIEVIGSRSDDESYTPSANFYKPEPLSIPGLGGSSAQAFGSAISPPLPGIFGDSSGGRGAAEYAPPLSDYGSQEHSYTPAPLNPSSMPVPPPLPPSIAPTAVGGDDFNNTWDLNMTWTPLDSLNSSNASYTGQSTPHSPPHFERKAHSGSNAPIEYSEHHNSSVLGAEDVDHRTLQLPPAFSFNTKVPVSRNLISLTGSPGGGEKEFGDVDYRVVPGKIEEISAIPSLSNNSPSNLMAPPSNYAKKGSSPHKSNASSSSESDRVDGSTRYDPADMVVDMDMSDEDMDESLREANSSQEELDQSEALGGEVDANGAARPALLATPPEFLGSSVWDENNSFGNIAEMTEMQQQQQQQQQQSPQAWNQMQMPPLMPWNGNDGSNGPAPPPPRPPFGPPFGFPQFPGPPGTGPDGNMNMPMRGRGRGRGWSGPYRPNFQRMPGNGGGNFDGAPRPFFNRGRGGRGRMRGNAWM